jgi:hypothetical protein
MSDLSIAIQHTPGHIDRQQWTQAMVTQLQTENPEISISVIQDSQRQGCWPTYRRTLEAANGATHHIVLQDDVELCDDFLKSVKTVIGMRSQNLIELYTHSPSAQAVRERGESWMQTYAAHGPGLIWPRNLISEFLNWQDQHIDPNCPWDDIRISMWLVKTSRQAFATVPSLIQHLGGLSSVMGLNSAKKIATWYIGATQSGTQVDWTKGFHTPLQDSEWNPDWWQYFRA